MCVCVCGALLQYLGVLVGGDGGEVGLWEGDGVVGAPAERVDAVRLDHQEPRGVPVHGVQDDLKTKVKGKPRNKV